MSENMITEALVNRKTGEVMEIGLQKSPDEIMLDAHGAAKTLQKLIEENKRKPLKFNDKQFLEYPHWQTVGAFYHTSVATGEAEFVEIGGFRGFKARAHVLDVKTGLVVGYAEAYCMNDEPNWKHKPLFQLASMAQTRAGSKALANKYRYVAILAGYEPTPAEEADMSSEKNLQAPKEKEPVIPFGSSPELPLAAIVGDLISDKQRKMLFARTREKGISEDQVKAYIWNAFEIEHTADLTRKDFDVVLKWVDTYVAAGK